jgi:CRISPR-associated protein Cmr5
MNSGDSQILFRLWRGTEKVNTEPSMNTTSTTAEPTLDQRRAKHAWEAVTSFTSPKDAEEYAREAKKLPMRIIAAGLGQALAFLLAKAKDKKPNLKRLHEHLTDWVIEKRPLSSAKRKHSLMESLLEGDAEFLRRATDEVLAYLQWLNRFAEAQGLAEGEDRT